MSLAAVQLSLPAVAVPAAVQAICDDAQTRIEDFDERHRNNPLPAFVPSDFLLVHRALAEIDAARLAPGRRFVEWGCGLGVVTCLAALAGFDAVGIEIEPELITLSRDLAAAHAIEAEFVEGSFLPAGADEIADLQGDVAWLSTTGTPAYEQLQLEADDFDLVFCYPWPGEEQVIFDVFSRYAATGALLLTYHGQEGIRCQRKVRHKGELGRLC